MGAAVEQRDMEIFLTLADELHFGRAAQRCTCPRPGSVRRSRSWLALVGAGVGTYPVSAQFTSYYVRPDVVYVPIHDASPYQRRFRWLSAAETATIRAFDQAAATLAEARP
jgi:hypothetical protein